MTFYARPVLPFFFTTLYPESGCLGGALSASAMPPDVDPALPLIPLAKDVLAASAFRLLSNSAAHRCPFKISLLW